MAASVKVLASLLVVQLAAFAAADPMSRADVKVPTPTHKASAISVFTYIAGGPLGELSGGRSW